MKQACHSNMTHGVPDLTRLHWNANIFRTRRRRAAALTASGVTMVRGNTLVGPTQRDT